jgi:predicted O-methyltransferase YrrM
MTPFTVSFRRTPSPERQRRRSSLTDELRSAPPMLHGAGDESWALAWPALQWLESNLTAGMATLETGAGASTIVFAASGAVHESITLDQAEVGRLRQECARRGISLDNVMFRIGPSHEILPALERRPLDLVLIDGAHGFPYPVLDWWHLAPRLRVGGLLVLDDCYMPPIAVLIDHIRARPSWRIVERPGRRTVVAEKVDDALPAYVWRGERIGSGLTFRHLPLPRRAQAALVHRLFESRPGLEVVEAIRRLSRARR